MSDYTILRAAQAPDFTGDSAGAFLGYGRALGAEQLAVNVRVLAPHSAHVPAVRDDAAQEAAFLMISVRVQDHAAESQGHDAFWPDE